MAGEIFGFKCGLKNIEIAFVQSCLQKGSLVGEIFVPYLEKRVGIELNLDITGNFRVSLTGPQSKNPDTGVEMQTDGLLRLRKEDLVEALVESVAFEKRNDIIYFRLSGQITPLFKKQELNWQTFKVSELLINSKGQVSLEGGWLHLREQKPLSFYGFQVEITKLGFGQTEDGGKWIGFSGGIKLVDGLPVGASVEGLRIVWYDDGSKRQPYVTFNGVGIDFGVPGVLKFKGAVSYNSIQQSGRTIHRFDGDIKLSLTTLNMDIDAVLVVGSDTALDGSTYNFFAIYLGVELPAGIPLWSTGLALYGMAGLFALEMEPNKGSNEGWYENPDGSAGWYKRDTPGVTDLKTKWDPRQGSLAFGVGATLGTLPDNGTSFHGKFLLVIVFPGPIILLEGRGDLLRERAKLDKGTQIVREPLFRALAVLDNRAGTLTIGLDAQYKYDKDGQLIDIRGSSEAFFSFADPEAWHIFIGRAEPREMRIRALIFRKLFEANAYFMLAGKNPFLRVGEWMGIDINENFGPMALNVEAFIDGNAIVSRKPTHLHGELLLHGSIKVGAFGFGFTISTDASCTADVFDPYHIVFDFHVAVDLPWFLPDLSADFSLEWGPKLLPPPLPLPLKEVAIENFKVTTSWPLPRGILLVPDYDQTGDGFLQSAVGQSTVSPADVPVVPLDSRPHITFGRAVNYDANVGVNPQPANSQWEPIGDQQGPVRARYSLEKVTLEKFVNGSSANPSWEQVAWAPNTDMKTELYGSWAPVPSLTNNGSDNNGSSVDHVKLWLWSKTPFDYSRHSGRAWDDAFANTFPDYPCVPPVKDREICCRYWWG